MNNNIGYANLIIGLFIALWVKAFTRKYNIYEIIVMLCFVLGVATLILALAMIAGALTESGFIVLGLMLIFLFYPIWAIGQFFGKHRWLSYLQALLVVILGYSSYLLMLLAMGYLWKITSRISMSI